MFWELEKSIFQFFANFSVPKYKPCSGKSRQSVKIYVSLNLDIRPFLENGFRATSRSKTIVVSVLKEHFSVSCKFLSDEVETIFWESKSKHSRLFKRKLFCKKLLRKWSWSYFELKKRCCQRLKSAFLRFFQFFVVEVETISLESEGKR